MGALLGMPAAAASASQREGRADVAAAGLHEAYQAVARGGAPAASDVNLLEETLPTAHATPKKSLLDIISGYREGASQSQGEALQEDLDKLRMACEIGKQCRKVGVKA